MAYSQEIKDYAKEIFLTISKDGKHKYSLDDIVEKIRQKFDKIQQYPDRSTINNWINKKDKITKKSWKDIWKAGIKSGIEKINIDIENNLDAEEKIEFKVDNITYKRATFANKIYDNKTKKLDKNKLTYQDIAEVKLAEIIYNNLNLELDEDDNNREPLLDDEELENILREEGYLNETKENKNTRINNIYSDN